MLEQDALLGKIVAAHHGVFSRTLARQAGFSDPEIDRRLCAGAWVELFRGVYRTAATPTSWHGELLASCWAGGIRACASHRSAAHLWGLPGGTRDVLELTCPRWRRARHGALVVHETKSFESTDRTMVGAIPVSSVGRTLLDLGAVTSKWTVERAVERALHDELITLDELWSIVRRLGRQGRNGVGVLRHILIRRGRRPAAESEMEVRLIQLLRAQGLPEPQRQHVIELGGRFVARADLAYPEWRIAIEYNSIQHHANRDALVRDSARQNAVVAAGYTPMIATIDDFRDQGQRLAMAIRDVAGRFGVTFQR